MTAKYLICPGEDAKVSNANTDSYNDGKYRDAQRMLALEGNINAV